MNEFEVVGEERSSLGGGAARRLRREGKVPAILYGGEQGPVPFTLLQNDVKQHLDNEAFLSHILRVKIGGRRVQQAVLKAVQRDPVSAEVTHMDLQRVSQSTEIQMHVPLHFVNEEDCPGVKVGGIVTHLVVEVDVRCLPASLPEYIDVDMSCIEIGDTVMMSDLSLPDGVDLVALRQGEEYDQALVSVQLPRVAEVEEGAEEEEEGEFDEEISKLVESGTEDEA